MLKARETLGIGAGASEGGSALALVPTMGALHEGHRSLIRLARRRAAHVVVSIFVNPLQFGPSEDFSRYPRTFDADLEVCEAEGVDVVFAPSVEDMYLPDRQVGVSAGQMGAIVEGEFRPGHLDGMLTVVLKLFNLVQPDVAVFGQKDAQQLAMIRRMVADLNLPVSVLGAPTVREPDGLALSSRNRYLSPEDRVAGLALSRALNAGAGQRTPAEIRRAALAVLEAEPSLAVDYLVLVDPATFAEVGDDHVGEGILAVAARVGSTRLIDNVTLTLR
ncbi:pantoate--beta-alanine ligase [Streptosporangium sp. NBC_01755]|uniref:pantoate--beta-alanine ligase n=1 Tax=unclassified Streptosporangium TaxID=2632669 RepID=UPI002DDB221B|nr:MULTISPECIES: pantoate--beta-alanine ligase [unclassified Streptosporangium]WSA29756.1 pantoate--beta-alanine ligase [Streptosporangium sp. NBC_01810]WSD04107.1 pantoate--beta-alanine ligase [Streptosporangium sp. NBC_01755]